jgi:uncharacterized membrane protein YhhN
VVNESLSSTTFLPPTVLSFFSVCALVWCDWRGLRPGRYLCKPLAAAAFVWLALSLDATHSAYGRWLLAALLFCMAGDLLLMPDTERGFLAGLGAFLCGHVLFAIAFLQLPANLVGLAISSVPVAVMLVTVWRWLLPHVNREMKVPVMLYIVVISGMLLCAGFTAGAAAGQPTAWLIIGGAWGFACSDLAVARRQFIKPSSRLNSAWGTPLYFFSQMTLASSLALVAH